MSTFKCSRRDIDFLNYFREYWGKMANSTDINPIFRHWPVLASGCLLCTAEQVSHIGSASSLLFFRPSSGSGAGTLLCEKIVFGYQTRFAWMSAIISFLITELGFSSVILGKCSPSFGFQQSGCQEGANQTLKTHLVRDSGFSSTNAPSLRAWYHTWYIAGLQLICLPTLRPQIWRDLPFPSRKFQNKAFIKNLKKKLFISYWGIAN